MLGTCHDGLVPLLSPSRWSSSLVLPAIWVRYIQCRLPESNSWFCLWEFTIQIKSSCSLSLPHIVIFFTLLIQQRSRWNIKCPPQCNYIWLVAINSLCLIRFATASPFPLLPVKDNGADSHLPCGLERRQCQLLHGPTSWTGTTSGTELSSTAPSSAQTVWRMQLSSD